MKRHVHGGTSHALSAFFATAGIVLAIVVAALTLRALIAPSTNSWTVWTTSALALLALFAILLWLIGAWIAQRVHRARRNRVETFLTPSERARIIDAVQRFEKLTSGEIRVHLAEHSQGDPVRAAAQAFEALGMAQTRDRNGVLIFVSVHDHRVAIVGDTGIHERVPEGFWEKVIRAIEEQFADGRYVDGLLEGITRAGARLTDYFPPRADDTNELPDTISDDTH